MAAMSYRRIAVLVVALAFAAVLPVHGWSAAAAAPAEDAPVTTVTEPDEPLEGDDIIPLPNSGREPTEAGDRGGVLQVLVLVLIVGGVAAIVGLIARESRRARSRQH
jgi:hypothetical protein